MSTYPRSEYLMFNPCDGYHVVRLRDGEFYCFNARLPWPRRSIVCWAKLPRYPGDSV